MTDANENARLCKCGNPSQRNRTQCSPCKNRGVYLRRKERAGYRKAGSAQPAPVYLDRFKSKIGGIDPVTGCQEWQAGKFDSGYGAYTEDGYLTGAHRWAYAMYHGEVPAGLWVLHHCDNPPCVAKKHLYIGKHSDNERDKIERKRYAHGERHGMARLSDDEVIGYRLMYKDGKMSAADISREIGMSAGMCAAMIGGKTWKHVPYAQDVSKERGQVRGVKVSLAKLDDEKIRIIRGDLARGISRLELARRFGVNKSTIRDIDNGNTWKHVI